MLARANNVLLALCRRPHSDCPLQCQVNRATLTVAVTPVVYCMAMITFLGWFFFVLFGGIGLAALPLDLLNDFANRPQRIDLEEFAKQKMILNERAAKLLEIGRKFSAEGRHQNRTRQNRRTYNKFKQVRAPAVVNAHLGLAAILASAACAARVCQCPYRQLRWRRM